jgi:hypothetical protein
MKDQLLKIRQVSHEISSIISKNDDGLYYQALKGIGEMAQGLYPVNSVIHKISYGFSFDSADSSAECAWGLSSSVKKLREFARFALLDSALMSSSYLSSLPFMAPSDPASFASILSRPTSESTYMIATLETRRGRIGVSGDEYVSPIAIAPSA